MPKYFFYFSVLLLIFASTHSVCFSAPLELGQDIRSELAAQNCAPAALDILKKWQAMGPWVRTVSANPEAKILRSPTTQIGKWIEARLEKKEIHLTLFNRESRINFSFQKNCSGSAQVSAWNTEQRFGGEAYYGGFRVLRDNALSDIITSGGSGVIYLWTPHKRISVEGLKEAMAAAKKVHLPLLAVVEPTSTPSLAKKVAAEIGLPLENIQYLDSFDLAYRGFRLHFPSLIVFNGGKFTSQVRRGYEDRVVYEEYFRKYSGIL